MPSLVFLTAFVTTAILIVILYPWAEKIGFMDKPNDRKRHQNPIPMIGGIAIYLGMIVTLLIFGIQISAITPFLIASTILVVAGLIDDKTDLGVRYRILAQITAALIVTQFSDVKITDLGDLFGTGNINLGIFSTAFSVFAIVGGINAFNMIDGIDGLAGTLALVTITAIAVVSGLSQYWPIYYFSLILIAAIIAFLVFNLRIVGRQNAAIFLGDTGSTLLGFSVCWLLICVSQGNDKIIPPVSVFWLTAVPFFDSISVMYRRIKNKRSPWSADREHLHHFLAAMGFDVNHGLMILMCSAILFSVVSMVCLFILNVPEQVLFFAFFIILGAYCWGINKAWDVISLAKPPSVSARTTVKNNNPSN